MESENDPFENDPLHQYGLDDWVRAFDEVYGRVNEKRSTEGILLHAVEHASEIQEDLRIGRYHAAIFHLTDAFCWMCGLVSRSAKPDCYGAQASYHEQVISKFPRLCYHCTSERCICSATKGAGIEVKELKEAARKENEQRLKIARSRLQSEGMEPTSLYQLQKMFLHIYSHVNFVMPLDYVIAHFQEEVGEVAECVNNLEDLMPKWREQPDLYRASLEEKKKELELELADAFSWTLALLLKLDYMFGSTQRYLAVAGETGGASITEMDETFKALPQRMGLTLPRVLWTRYGVPDADPAHGLQLRCPRCGKSQCDG